MRPGVPALRRAVPGDGRLSTRRRLINRVVRGGCRLRPWAAAPRPGIRRLACVVSATSARWMAAGAIAGGQMIRRRRLGGPNNGCRRCPAARGAAGPSNASRVSPTGSTRWAESRLGQPQQASQMRRRRCEAPPYRPGPRVLVGRKPHPAGRREGRGAARSGSVPRPIVLPHATGVRPVHRIVSVC